MAGLYVLHAYDRDNITGLSAVNFVTIISMHLNHSANTFGFSGKGVKYGVALVQYARVDAHKSQCTEAVVHDFKGKCFKRLSDWNDGSLSSLITIFVSQWLRYNIGWAR